MQIHYCIALLWVQKISKKKVTSADDITKLQYIMDRNSSILIIKSIFKVVFNYVINKDDFNDVNITFSYNKSCK